MFSFTCQSSASEVPVWGTLNDKVIHHLQEHGITIETHGPPDSILALPWRLLESGNLRKGIRKYASSGLLESQYVPKVLLDICKDSIPYGFGNLLFIGKFLIFVSFHLLNACSAPRHKSLQGPIVGFVPGFDDRSHRCFGARVMPSDGNWHASMRVGQCEAECTALYAPESEHGVSISCMSFLDKALSVR